MRRQCEESLRRLETDHVELLYLHAPDCERAGGGIGRRTEAADGRGKDAGGRGLESHAARSSKTFAAECPPAAFQPPYNMLMRQIEADTLPWCREHGVAVLVYWPLMKGLLAGKISRDYRFWPRRQPRTNIPCSMGEERQKNHDLVDRLARDRPSRRPHA